jgi:FkbM family methyltransferase
MIDAVAKLVWFAWSHPLNRGGRMQALSRILRWQISSRLLPEASFLLPLVGQGAAGLLVRRGMTGATGNWYCGLDEMEDMGFLLHALRPGDLFLDVGANIGSYSILAAAGVGANVIAVEPISETFSSLLANVRVNDLANLISAHRIGLSAEPGALSFTTALDSMNHVLADGEEAASETVQVTTMDALCEARSPVVIKIDVEGHEMAVLRGAEQTLADPKLLAVIMELNGSGARYGISDANIDAWMTGRGFSRCRYSPLDRQLLQSDHSHNHRSPKTSSNVLYARDFDALKRRVLTAPCVGLINCSI